MTPLAALVFAWSLTALWPLIGAAGMRHYSGGLFTTAGLCVGLTALSPYLLAQGRWRRVLSRRTAPSLAAMGFCGARWSNSPEALATLLAQGLLMSSLNFVLWYMAIRNMELSAATTTARLTRAAQLRAAEGFVSV
jgi:hypothetical protein